MKDTVVLTGATGFLGSHILAALIKKGRRVIVFARGARGETAEERISRILAWFGINFPNPQIEVYTTDLIQPRCGLDADDYGKICSETGMVLHCASDTRFSERCRKEVTVANVLALDNILEITRASDAVFHYISTAYSAGKAGICSETLPEGTSFNNIYEETKAEAEKKVVSFCNLNNIPWTIIRPSIVYGDSVTGRSNAFYALYFHVRSLECIRDIYVKDIDLNEGRKAAECGIHPESNGVLRLPLRIHLRENGMINLIPVDYFVTAAMAVFHSDHHNMIYNLTSDYPSSFSDLAVWCERFLDIRGIDIKIGHINGYEYSPAESLLNSFLDPYLPYLSDNRKFIRKNIEKVFPGPPPAITWEIFERCMKYAVSVKWQKVL